MPTVEQMIDVELPTQTVYNQWTQFEEFPQFMSGVEEVTQVDDTHLHWVAKIAGVRREWDAEIVQQHPDQGIAWRSESGFPNAGYVTFEPQGPDRTRVRLRLDYEPESATEKVGDKLGVVEQRVQGDLERFKKFVEERGTATGAWRGEVN